MTTERESDAAAPPAQTDAAPSEELAYRLRQQELLAAFGLRALQADGVDALLQEATRLCAEGLRVPFCKLLERLPDPDRLLVRAGVGWREAVVGATVGADLASPAGYALRTGEPVIANDLPGDPRFRLPRMLAEHGVRRAIDVVIRGDGEPFGVLEADSPAEGRFTPADLTFMQGFAHLIGVAIDRHRAAAALRASEERFRSLVEHMPRKMWVNRPDGSVDYLNAAWRAYTGQPAVPADASWIEAVHPEDRPRLLAARAPAIAAAAPYELDLRLRRAEDGAYRWHRASVAPLRRDGELFAWAGIASDIDDARRAEAALRESEALFRTLADSIPQLAWMARPDGWIFWYNRRWYEYTGTTLEQMQGWGWRAVHHPDHVDRVVARIQRSWDTGEPWEDTFPLRGKDGRYRWFLSRALPIRDAEGRIVRWFGTNTDVTEQREAAERQQFLRHELSHRVKNILATIQVIARQTLRSAASLESFGQSFEARLAALASTHDLLTASHWEGAELRDIVGDELAPYRGAGEGRVRIEGEPVALPPTLALTAGLVFHELATNAAKHGALSVPAGRVHVAWTVEETARGRRLRLAWTETGGPPVTPPRRRGFGSHLIERSLVHEAGGIVRLDFAAEGVRCAIELPLPGSGREVYA